MARLKRELKRKTDASIEMVAELSLGETPVQQLVPMLHEHSVNGVIISARHTYFEQVENAIRTCELEGIEAWLVADFFGTQISHAHFDELLGYPLLVFRTGAGILLAGRHQATHGFFRRAVFIDCLVVVVR